MSFKNDYLLLVDIKHSLANVIPTFGKGDNGRLRFRIYDDNVLYDLSGFTKAEIRHEMPSGMVFFNEATLNSNNEIEFVYDEPMLLSEVGKVNVSLIIYSGDKHVSIQPFVIYIYDNLNEHVFNYIEFIKDMAQQVQLLKAQVTDVIDRANEKIDELTDLGNTLKDDFNTLEQHLKDDFQNLEDLILDNEDEREKNEQQRIDSENNRQDAEQIREDNETERIKNENERIKNEDERIQNDLERQEKIDNIKHLDEYSGAIEYKVGNIVSFDGSSYMNVKDSLGIPPTDKEYWKLVGKKGDAGANLTYRGIYSDVENYTKDDLVSYQGRLYVCIQDSVGVPVTDTNHWVLFMDKTIVDIKQEEFIYNRTNPTITLLEGEYISNAISVHIGGVKQPNSIFEEVSNNQIKIIEDIPDGTRLMVEYIQIMNVDLYANEQQRQLNEEERIKSENNRVHKGKYDDSAIYQKHNEVYYDGSTWRCLKDDTQGKEPVEGEFWTQVSARGLDGILKSNTPPSDIEKDRVWLDTTKDILKLQNEDGSWRDMFVRTKLIFLKEEYIATADDTSTIPITNYYDNNADFMLVYYLGLKLNEGEHYNVAPDNLSIELDDWSIDTGEKIVIYILKTVFDKDIIVSGSQLANESVGKIKLTKLLQDEIDNKINSDLIGVPNGIARLNEDGKVIDSDGNETYVPTKLSELEDDENNRLVTDAEKDSWNNKYDKPTDGIPLDDLSVDVKDEIDKKYEKPTNGIPLEDLAQDVKDAIDSAVATPIIESFISSEGQSLFSLSGTYETGKGRLRVIVGNIEQFESLGNFEETSENSFTLAEELPQGISVVAIYYP